MSITDHTVAFAPPLLREDPASNTAVDDIYDPLPEFEYFDPILESERCVQLAEDAAGVFDT